MEIIELSSYLEVEKKHIARDFLLPRQIKEHGLKPGNISLPEETLTEVIRSYTREAGSAALNAKSAHCAAKPRSSWWKRTTSTSA